MPKPMSTSFSNIRKDCKLRIPFIIIRDVERLIFSKGFYKYFNDFAIDAITEKLERDIHKKKGIEHVKRSNSSTKKVND